MRFVIRCVVWQIYALAFTVFVVTCLMCGFAYLRDPSHATQLGAVAVGVYVLNSLHGGKILWAS